jgi:predicted cupin superfamily sugar epimerase
LAHWAINVFFRNLKNANIIIIGVLNKDAVKLIKRLRLKNHPEGGYFKQTYTADTIVNVVGYDKPRYISTAIYYMLVGDQFSALHRIKSDELWHHYTGGSLTLYAIHNGKLSKIKMGKSRGEAPQVAIKANTWFAASLNDKKSYCLLGCTVSPGFDYSDWELGKRNELIKMYPQHRTIIERYTAIV